MKSKPPTDALTFALDAVNDRWSLHIIRALALGASRFTEVLRDVGAPRDVLTTRLRSLQADGLVRRVDDANPRSGYSLTVKGRDLAQVVLVLKKWGDQYGDETLARRTLIHEVCGHPFEAVVSCSHCGEPVGRGTLRNT